MSGLAATAREDQRIERRPLRAHSLEMVVGLIGGLVAVATALFATSADGRKSAIVVQSVSALVFLWVAQIGIREESNPC
jgi:hypothetical protein